ncbi:IclR family transcriptional regulator [Paraburkholderia sp. CNPSo 3274]|uniref:IclR family transcriptional regulator n=1 Tax=Paraburkholderia sp. CNPSo 3274 TaxID=2940932 RepID=UPI0020B7E281|nr:IclR family transcriptional regulator [Paraburkholderia sp. CNPSo 3274]MCP3709509.1 IclR family transcriptional regulator [Paraburkholderia sp. CNPSo 3274]
MNASEKMPRHASETVLNRSLERGLLLLRAFGPGADALGNGDFVERTGLPKATVSRLARTLVECGFLQHDAVRQVYRLGVPVLSVAHAMRTGSRILQASTPLMREVAQKRQINVGLAAADGDDMVYLESFRYNQRASLRTVVSGQRVPMELTALGRAHLSTLDDDERARRLASLERRGSRHWKPIRRQILEAIDHVRRLGYCVASWQPEVVALATPLTVPGHPPVMLNFSVRTTDTPSDVSTALAAPLLQLREAIVHAMAVLESD